jgi:hypothetical protein
MLTSLSLTKSRTSSVEPRMAVSNNDCTVKFFDVNVRGSEQERIKEIGSLKIDVPVNHCESIFVLPWTHTDIRGTI